MYLPRFFFVLVSDRRPAFFRVNLSSGVSNLRGANVSPGLIFFPPSHQFALVEANIC